MSHFVCRSFLFPNTRVETHNQFTKKGFQERKIINISKLIYITTFFVVKVKYICTS
ncbi:hypothetical protein EMIT036CA2_50099 [Chryseobacterium sp. IT-36CA2]